MNINIPEILAWLFGGTDGRRLLSLSHSLYLAVSLHGYITIELAKTVAALPSAW